MGVFAKDGRRKMETNENEVAATEECKRNICDMIMSLEDDKMVFYFFGFIKSMIE